MKELIYYMQMFPLISNSSGVTNEDEQLLVSQHKWHYVTLVTLVVSLVSLFQLEHC